ncbi:hypothetical protein HDU79_000665 [Rhizoclosmatium sp. JEL0117]|nr:hypothetical protein HDU79_000665 [Rhizoclosmatium sp. JEL0117]
MDEELPPSKRPRRTTASANSATGTNDEDDGSSGSEAGSTPAPNATSIVTEVKPAKGKPGRKRIEVIDPNNKRIAQNRVAQRNYRERQIQHFKDLEAKVAELTELLNMKSDGGGGISVAGTSSSGNNTVRAFDESALLAELSRLQQQVSFLRIENTNLKSGGIECQTCTSLKNDMVRLNQRNQLLESRLSFLESELQQQQLRPSSSASTVSYRPSPLMSSSMTSSSMAPPSLSQQFLPPPTSTLLPLLPPIQSPYPPVNPNSPSYLPPLRSTPMSASPRYPSSDIGSAVNSHSETTRIPSSEELYGPIEIEQVTRDLKSLVSLANSPLVDIHLRVFQDQTRHTDVKSIKHGLVQLIASRRRLLDACNVLDRKMCIEYLEATKQVNKKHMDYMYQYFHIGLDSGKSPLGSSPTSNLDGGLFGSASSGGGGVGGHGDGTQRIERIAKTVTDMLAHIPALNGAKDLIDELADILASSNLGQESSDGAEKFFRFVEVQSKLQALCHSETDRTNLMLAIEIGRESNRKHMVQWDIQF